MYNSTISADIGCMEAPKCDSKPSLQGFGAFDGSLPKRNVVALPGPKTRQEQWAWLVSDARRILRSPLSHREEEVVWARDVIALEGAKKQ